MCSRSNAALPVLRAAQRALCCAQLHLLDPLSVTPSPLSLLGLADRAPKGMTLSLVGPSY